MENDEKKIRMFSSGGRDGEFSLRGLKPEEIENMEGMLHNHFWVTVNHDGRLETIRRKELVPGPTEDEDMLPFWSRHKSGAVQTELFETEDFKHRFPSIVIQHLCGYGYTPERHKDCAQQLESYGFECMRSRRGENGRYWEIWLLLGPWSAKGELGKAVRRNKKKDELDVVIDFLCRYVSFGSLDIMVQRAAMSMDDL